jgi:hypothetical protein
MVGEDLTERRQGRSTKNAARHKPRNSRDEKPATDARRITMLPGAAARAPIKKDSNVRPRGAATKVRTPFRQTRDAILKAAFASGGITCDRGTRQQTNQLPADDQCDYLLFPVGDA